MLVQGLTYNNDLLLKHHYKFKFVVAFNWEVVVGIDGELKKIVINKDFITDFATVPRLFWRVLPPYGNYTNAAVLHDFLYFTGIFDRKTCDQIFALAMKKDGVKKWKIWIMYRAVRFF